MVAFNGTDLYPIATCVVLEQSERSASVEKQSSANVRVQTRGFNRRQSPQCQLCLLPRLKAVWAFSTSSCRPNLSD